MNLENLSINEERKDETISLDKENEENNENKIPKKRKISLIWNYFKLTSMKKKLSAQKAQNHGNFPGQLIYFIVVA